MLAISSRLLIILLVFLQLLAPLVHAHTGEQQGNGFHMPGLEQYNIRDISLHVVNASNDLHYKATVVIGIGSAINHKKADIDHPADDALLVTFVLLFFALLAINIFAFFPPQTRYLNKSYSQLLARAPPVVIF